VLKYINMGHTGLKVSRFCMGTMVYGSQVSESDSIEIIHKALAAGVNFFDTADCYIDGKSEEVVGKALKKDRHAVVIATKVGNDMGPGPNEIGLSRAHIMQGVEDSLRRLQTDYIDLYYAHLPDKTTPIDETLRALDDIVRAGKVRYVGCSNFRAWQVCKALWVSSLHGYARLDCVQPPYNLVTRDIEMELLPLCENEGVGVVVYNPLASGLLTGKHNPDKPPAKGTRFSSEDIGTQYRNRWWSDANFKAVDRLREIAVKYNRTMAQLALAWTLSNNAITAVSCGATSVKQLEENIAAASIELSKEEIAACNQIWEMFRAPRFAYWR
jgi:1-deoxyxylulose-5-phosphate synthase